MLITQYLTPSTSREIYLVLHRLLSVFALTVDRLLAIHLHLRYQELVTHKSVVVVVSSVWVLSAFIALLGLTEMDTDSWLYPNPIAIIGRIVEH